MSRYNPIGGLLSLIFGRRHPAPAPPPAPVPPPPIDAASASALFRAINAARAAAGRPPLAQSPDLSAVAAAWAARIASTGVLDHGNAAQRIASVAPGRASGETIGLGWPDATSEVNGWLGSPGHRSILLGAYSVVGVGVGVGRDGRLAFVADFFD